MSKTKEAMKLALEALAIADNIALVGAAYTPKSIDAGLLRMRTAMSALREALAEQPAQQEPVLQEIEQYRLQMAGICTAAIGYWKEGDGIHPDYDTLALRDVAKLYAKYDKLYSAQRKPLTNEEITKAFNEAMAKRPKDASNAETNRLFVRAIEAAHKIKE